MYFNLRSHSCSCKMQSAENHLHSFGIQMFFGRMTMGAWSRRLGNGEGYSPPSRLGGMGSCCKPQPKSILKENEGQKSHLVISNFGYKTFILGHYPLVGGWLWACRREGALLESLHTGPLQPCNATACRVLQSINQSKLFVSRAMSCTSSNLRRGRSPVAGC